MGLLDDLLGKTAAKASNAAAADTYAKQQAATGAITDYGNDYNSQFQNLAQGYQPYVNAGGSALSMLLNGLGLNGSGGSQAFTDAYRATPGYQAGLDTGVKSATQAANAGGMLNSGATLKALDRYGSDYEDQKSGNYLAQLMGLQGQGLQATGAQIGTQAQGLQGQLQTRQSAYSGDMSAAPTVGQGMVAGAQAQQTGITNLLGAGTYLGGSFLGGPFGKALANKWLS